MRYEECPHYCYEDTTPWHSDVFDHPEYTHYCLKDGEKKEIIPYFHCHNCPKRGKNNG